MFINNDLKEILNTGIALTTEKNYGKLLELILKKTIKIEHCDAGILYMYEKNTLYAKKLLIESLHIIKDSDKETFPLFFIPMKEEMACAYCAIHKEVIYIEDLDQNQCFDFSIMKKFDACFDYHTKSMFIIPLKNHEDTVIGVIQLMNALDSQNNPVPFPPSQEFFVLSLACQAAAAISNINYVTEIKDLLYSFVLAMSTAIDARTPYNGTHTRKVACYCELLINYINEQHRLGLSSEYFDDNRKEQLILAAHMHDLGKMVIPLSIMNKATRLGNLIHTIEQRFLLLHSYLKIDFLEKRLSKEAYEKESAYLDSSLKLIQKCNAAGPLSKTSRVRLQRLSKKIYQGGAEKEFPYLTSLETECLMIERGTLTCEERTIMESHVEMTSKILENIPFNQHYKNIPFFAAAHHEFLDGSGYPNHLTAKDMPLEVRILSAVDVFDALTASDRPYKKTIPFDESFSILTSMAEEGKLDSKIVTMLYHALKKQEGKES